VTLWSTSLSIVGFRSMGFGSSSMDDSDDDESDDSMAVVVFSFVSSCSDLTFASRSNFSWCSFFLLCSASTL
jgi:hypothetical protein